MVNRFLLLSALFISSQTALAQQEVSLEQVIALALEKNYDIKVVQNDKAAALTDKGYTVGAFLPQINAVGSTVWNSNDQELRFEDASRNNEGKSSSNNISASVQLVWTLFDGTRMFAARNRINETAEQSDLLLKDQVVNTIATVIGNYYDIVRQKQQLKAIEEQMAVSEERVKLADRKLQVGTGAKPELLQARVDYNAQRAQALQQEALILQLKEQLNGLLGEQLPPAYDVADTILIDLSLDREDIQSNIENANFGLQAARRNISIANSLVREQYAEKLPWLNFNAAYNYSRSENTRIINPFGPLFNASNGYTYGFTVNIPILNNLNNSRLVQQAKLVAERQQILFDQQKIAVNVALKNAFTSYDNARKILIVEEENILVAKENVAIALEVFKRGATTFVELRTAQQSLAEAYTRLINARYLAKVAETELLRLNGALLK